MTRVAGIDCGTNSIRLLVADNGRRCTVIAMAFRSQGANDRTGITAILSFDEAGRLAVEACVSTS